MWASKTNNRHAQAVLRCCAVPAVRGSTILFPTQDQRPVVQQFAFAARACGDSLPGQRRKALCNRSHASLLVIGPAQPLVSDLYEIDLRETAEGVRLFWQIREDRKNWREAREGAYLLRANLTADTAEELWSKYMQLTEAEASFRALKSELSVRPLFHQLEPRVKAHILVAFLGYALWVTLKHLLKRRPPVVSQPSVSGVDNAQPMTPMRAIVLLSTLQSAGHRSAHHRRPRDQTAADHRANSRAEVFAPAARNQTA